MIFHVNPVPKPRMTKSDRWKKRKCVQQYWQFKDEIRLQAEKMAFKMPNNNYHIIFYIEMPKSWSKKRKEIMYMQQHQQKPDKDNLEKGFLDALLDEDCVVWDGRVSKVWAYEGSIVVKQIEYDNIGVVPSLTILNDLMLKGAEIKNDGKQWVLKDGNEIFARGETIRKLLVNLIFSQC